MFQLGEINDRLGTSLMQLLSYKEMYIRFSFPENRRQLLCFRFQAFFSANTAQKHLLVFCKDQRFLLLCPWLSRCFSLPISGCICLHTHAPPSNNAQPLHFNSAPAKTLCPHSSTSNCTGERPVLVLVVSDILLQK